MKKKENEEQVKLLLNKILLNDINNKFEFKC